MKTFIRAMECWVPDNGRSHLEFGGGWYGDNPAFGAASKKYLFSRGEGLPGRAWESGEPVVLTEFKNSYFRRTAAAAAAGLSCGIAVPIFAGDFLTSVLVIFCGDDASHAGAIELWRAGPSAKDEMGLVDGYYGTTEELFGFSSKRTTFRKGIGLPGRVWELAAPVFIEDLGKSDQFLRADDATRVGINRGLGIPCETLTSHTCVMTFLSALGSPIAKRFEIWMPAANRDHLLRSEGFCERMGRLPASPQGPLIERGHGAIGKAFLSGVPAFSEYAAAELAVWEEELQRADISALAALPLIRDGRLQSVLVWYF
jgi:hypothetical protein